MIAYTVRSMARTAWGDVTIVVVDERGELAHVTMRRADTTAERMDALIRRALDTRPPRYPLFP